MTLLQNAQKSLDSESWYCVSMTTNQVAGGEGMRFQESYFRLFTSGGAPRMAALFAPNPFTSEHDGHHYYLSPGSLAFARSLIVEYRAKACAKPPPDAALLVGHDSAGEELL